MQIVFVLMFGILLRHLWDLQIINGQKYVDEFELRITKTIRDGNLRGNIYDCNGEILAYNTLVYTVTMVDNGSYASGRERQLKLNSMIYKVIRKLAENQEQLNNELKIAVGSDGSFEYTVTGRALDRFKADVFGEADPANLSEEQLRMSADEMIRFLAGNGRFALYGEGKKEYSEEELQKYGLPKEFTQEEVLNVVGIRYMLSLNAYRKYVPVILAGNVSEKMVAYIMENNIELPDHVWDTVKTGMVQYAQNNAVLKDMEIRMAGKTGTAQESKRRPDHALFVGYAPADAPEIAIAVRIANGYGSSNATAIGRSIFNYYFGIEGKEEVVTGRASSATNIRTD
ncbi:MAG: hypothetical protein K2P59_17175 [Acetatifactor sp.]|nr:hypothetical protein [Acetatifactor sp.]